MAGRAGAQDIELQEILRGIPGPAGYFGSYANEPCRREIPAIQEGIDEADGIVRTDMLILTLWQRQDLGPVVADNVRPAGFQTGFAPRRNPLGPGFQMKPASRRTIRCIVCLLCGKLRKCGRDQTAALPTPIDAMMANQPASNFHDLDEVNLIAVGRLARIFPNQHPATVGQPLTRAIPAYQVVWPALGALRKEMAQFGVTA